MKWLVFLLFALAATRASADTGCPAGTFQVIKSPDGLTISLLFDQFTLSSPAGAIHTFATKICDIRVPMPLAAGDSLGVYQVDYRGFAQLSALQSSELVTRYAFVADKRQRVARKLVKGAFDGDFSFTETVPEGTMARAGCGAATVFRIVISLALTTRGPAAASTTLDSVDGAPKRGLVYHFNVQKCK